MPAEVRKPIPVWALHLEASSYRREINYGNSQQASQISWWREKSSCLGSSHRSEATWNPFRQPDGGPQARSDEGLNGMPEVLAQMGGAFRDPGLPAAPRPPGPAFQTRLSPEEEAQFQNWVRVNKIPWQDTPVADYDMRGYWKAMTSGNPEA